VPRDAYREQLDQAVQEMRSLGAALDWLFAPYEIDQRTYPNSAGAVLRIAASIAADIEECVAALRDELREDAAFPRLRFVLEPEPGWRPGEWRCVQAGRGLLNLCVGIRAWSISLEREACAMGVPWNEVERVGEGDKVRLAEAWAQLRTEYDWVDSAEKGLWSADGPDEHNWTWERWATAGGSLLGLVLRLSELAIHLLKGEVERISTPAALRPSAGADTESGCGSPWSDDDRAEKTYISADDFEAKERRLSGEVEPRWPTAYPSVRGSMTGGKKPSPAEGPFRGSGYHERLEAAIEGPNADIKWRALVASMPHVYVRKIKDKPPLIWGGWEKPPPGLRSANAEEGRFRSPHALTLDEVRRVYNAVAFANRRGKVMNASLTLAWFMLPGVDQIKQAKADEAFRHKLKQWFDSRHELSSSAREALFVYVQENPTGERFHTHLLLHLPTEMIERFKAYLPAAVAQTARTIAGVRGGDLPEGLHKARVRRHDRHALHSQWIRYHYVTKGADPETSLTGVGPCKYYVGDVMRFTHRDPGPVVKGRRLRVGASGALGPTEQSREALGFRSLLDEQIRSGVLDVRALFSDHYLREFNGEAVTEPYPPPTRAALVSPFKAVGKLHNDGLLARRLGRLI
jgi:hypothetical protein